MYKTAILATVALVLAPATGYAQPYITGAPRCGNVSALEGAANTACQADTSSLATSALNCLAYETTINGEEIQSYQFRFTQDGANNFRIYVEQSATGTYWVRYAVVDYATTSDPTIVLGTNGIDVDVSGTGTFMIPFSFRPEYRYMRVMVVADGGSPTTSDIVNDAKVCVR